ncbi:MAG: hypothetical protein MZV64_19435 [Ignavibacteriales bacterium]|nr:hypothetical protein [Ignavibacteriales bacterium]
MDAKSSECATATTVSLTRRASCHSGWRMCADPAARRHDPGHGKSRQPICTKSHP